MAPHDPAARRRLIVNADDFGRSASINEAVISAHRNGILTTASLMVNEPHCREAVDLARKEPRLGVGLHLSLVCGTPALPRSAIPGLWDGSKGFSNDAVATGMRYFFQGTLRRQLEAEITEQLQRFKETGLVLDHVNGHLNMHLHPVVFGILLRLAPVHGIRSIRLTRDPLRLNARMARGAWAYRISHAMIYKLLCAWAEPRLSRAGIRFTPTVFGLLQNGRVDESYLLKLLPALPAGDSELYSHPSVDEFRPEWEALCSARVQRLVPEQGISLIRYQDL